MDFDNESKLRAAIYIRVSTAEQVDGYSPDAQEKTILNYIEVRKNLEFAGEQYIYKDLAVSGAEPTDTRPEFMRLVNDIQYSPVKPFDVVIVYKLDRFARKLSILLEVVEQLEKLDVGFISTQESLDTNNAFGKAMLGILGVFSELERDMIQERTKLGIIEGLEKGSWYRTRRYGYQKDNDKGIVTIERSEANIVKKIFQMFVYDQKSVGEICKYLTEQKIPNPSAAMGGYGGKKSKYGPYHRADKSVRQILADEFYIGKYFYNKSIRQYIDKKRNTYKTVAVPREQRKLSPVGHQPFISESVFEKAQEKLLLKKGSQSKSKEDYLLSGLLKCDCCKGDKNIGRVAWVGNNSHGIKSYKCRGRDKARYGYVCPTTSVNVEALDTLVIEEMKRLINNPLGLIKALKKRESLLAHKQRIEIMMEENESKISSLVKRIENQKELRSDGEISKAEFQERIEKLQEELDYHIDMKKKLYKSFDEYFDIEAQQKAFEMLNTMALNVDKLFNNKAKTKEFLNLLIEEIVIFSEPNETLRFPGKKKDGPRYVPHTIMIKFRLPQDFLNGLYGEDDDPIDSPDTGGNNNRGTIKLGTPLLKKDVVKRGRGRPAKVRNLFSSIFDNELNLNIPHKLNNVPILQKPLQKLAFCFFIKKIID